MGDAAEQGSPGIDSDRKARIGSGEHRDQGRSGSSIEGRGSEDGDRVQRLPPPPGHGLHQVIWVVGFCGQSVAREQVSQGQDGTDDGAKHLEDGLLRVCFDHIGANVGVGIDAMNQTERVHGFRITWFNGRAKCASSPCGRRFCAHRFFAHKWGNAHRRIRQSRRGVRIRVVERPSRYAQRTASIGGGLEFDEIGDEP